MSCEAGGRERVRRVARCGGGRRERGGGGGGIYPEKRARKCGRRGAGGVGGGGAPLSCRAMRQVLDLCPVCLQIEQRCGLFLREWGSAPPPLGGAMGAAFPRP